MSVAIPATPSGAGAGELNLQRVMLLLLLVPFLGLLIFLLGVGLGVRGVRITELGLAVFTSVIALIPLIIDQGRRPNQRHLILSLFALIYTCYLVIPVFTYYLPGDGPKVPSGMKWAALMPADIVRSQWVALGGLIGLMAGYAFPLGHWIGLVLPAPRREWTVSESLYVGMGMILLGWFIFLAGPLGLIPARFGSGLLGVLARGNIYGIALLAMLYMRTRSPAALILLCVWLPTTMGINFFTGSKKAFLSAPAMIIAASIMVRGRIRARWIVVGVVVIALIYPVSEFYRNVFLYVPGGSMIEGLKNPGAVLSGLSEFLSERRPSEYFAEGLERTGSRLDGLGRAAVIIRETPRTIPFQGGWSIGYIFLAYIPRVLWPEKPTITIGQWVTTTYGTGAHVHSATGPTWIGELYMNFGVPGVIIGMSVFGLLLRVAHELFYRRSRTMPGLLAAGIVLYGSGTTVGGGLVGGVNRVTFALGPLFALHFALRLMNPKGGRPMEEPTQEREPDAALPNTEPPYHAGNPAR